MSDYDNTPAPIGWLERLDKRFMDHLNTEKEQWHKLHEELAILRTKMEMAEIDRKETKEALQTLVKDMAAVKGAYQQNKQLVSLMGAVATVASALAAWFGLNR